MKIQYKHSTKMRGSTRSVVNRANAIRELKQRVRELEERLHDAYLSTDRWGRRKLMEVV